MRYGFFSARALRDSSDATVPSRVELSKWGKTHETLPRRFRFSRCVRIRGVRLGGSRQLYWRVFSPLARLHHSRPQLSFLHDGPTGGGIGTPVTVGAAAPSSEARDAAALNSFTVERVLSLEPVIGTGSLNGFGTVGAFGVPAAIPEPATLALFGSGLLGLGFMARRRRLN